MQTRLPRNKTEISKTLSYFLRHGATKHNLNISQDGYVRVSELINTAGLSLSIDDLQNIVYSDSKQRFSMIQSPEGEWIIRANQGHTVSGIDETLLLQEIIDYHQFPLCIHGTYRQFWPSIKETGLSRMNRNHIHMAAGLPGTQNVKSGFRHDCDILIYIHLKRAMEDGIKFFLSENGVILSSGINGIIPPQYFDSVIDRKTNQNLIEPTLINETDESKKVEEITSAKQNFDYFIVVDFEATCCEDKKGINPQEIIEFPAILIDTSELRIVDEFQTYVKPVYHPILTDFCIRLTGIQQERVDEAPEFQEAFELFTNWLLGHNLLGDSPSFALISCGDWDFKTMLPVQFAVSNLSVPRFVKKWINLKHVFKSIMVKNTKGKQKPIGMVDMLQELELPLIGRHHSGIDDSRNITAILIELCRRGARPQITGKLSR